MSLESEPSKPSEPKELLVALLMAVILLASITCASIFVRGCL
jgi:hypothetical protein